MDITERLKFLRLELKLSQAKMANTIGLKASSYCDIEKGRQALTERNLNAICREFSVSEDWLRNGVGDMFVEIDTPDDATIAASALLENSNSPFIAAMTAMIKSFQELEKEDQEHIEIWAEKVIEYLRAMSEDKE